MSTPFLSKKLFISIILSVFEVFCMTHIFFQNDIAFAEKPDQILIPEIELIHKVVNVLAQSDLTSQNIAKKIGGSLIKTETAHSWEIEVSTSGVRIFTDAPDLSAIVKTVRIYFDLESNLAFRDLVREFGVYEVISESKTSSVRFDQVRGSRIQIFAHLFFSKVNLASPVLGIKIRLE